MNLAVPIEDFNIHSLGLVQRILVTTDGTLTETLAAMFLEPIELVKLAVTITQTPHPVPPLELEAGANVMQRQIVLRGSKSGTPYVYAEVVIATDQLPPRLRDDLLEGRVPLGALWILHRLEIFKDRPRVRQRPRRRARATSQRRRRHHADRADLPDIHRRPADLSGVRVFSG